MTALFVACSDSPQGTPTERATALVNQRSLSPYPIERLDSVYGYDDVHRMRLAAYNLTWAADSIILNQRSQKRLLNAKERDEIQSLSRSILALKEGAAKTELQYNSERRKKELVGLRTAFADSITGGITVVYFDTNVTKITGVDRNLTDL